MGFFKKVCSFIIIFVLLGSIFTIFNFNYVTAVEPPQTLTHDAGNFSLILDNAGGAAGGWDELKFPKNGNNYLSNGYLALGNKTDAISDGGSSSNKFLPGPYTNPQSDGIFDENSTTNFTGNFDGIEFNVYQKSFMNTNQTNKVGHDGRWLIVELMVVNLNNSNMAYDLNLMLYTNWDIDTFDNSDDSYLHFNKRNLSIIYDKTQGFYMATAQILGKIKGHNAGNYDVLLNDGKNTSVINEMFSPSNNTSDATSQDWYTDLVADLGDLGPGERTTVAFVFLAGNSTDELNASYDDAIKAYFKPTVSAPSVGGGSWKGGVVSVSATADDTAPGTIAEVQFQYSANSTDGTNGNWTNCTDSPDTTFPYQVNWNTVNASNGTDSEVWVRVRSVDDYGHKSPWRNVSVKVDNEAPETTDNYIDQWRKADFTITLTPTDNSGSGVSNNNIKYRINGGGEQSVGANGHPLITTESGTNTVEYWSIDNVGNEETPHEQLSGIKLDKQGPEISDWQLQPANLTEDQTGNLQVTVKITDGLSGFSGSDKPELRYKLGSEPYGNYADMTKVGADHWSYSISSPLPSWKVYRGKNITIQIRATDNVGNQRVSDEYLELIDNIIEIPTCTLSTPASGQWFGGLVEVSADAEDDDGQVEQVEFEYSLDSTDGTQFNGNWSAMSSSPVASTPYKLYWDTSMAGISQDSLVWVRARALDDDNKYSIFSVRSIKIDNLAPTLVDVTHSPTNLTALHDGVVTVGITLKDTGAGLNYAYGGSPDTELFPVLSYRIGDGSLAYITMTAQDSSYESWQCEIPAPAGGWSLYAGSELKFWLKIKDRLGNEALSNQNTVAIETIPFIIEHLPITTAEEGSSITFKANVTGGSGFSTVKAFCYYKFSYLGDYKELEMTMTTGGRSEGGHSRALHFSFEAKLDIPRPYPDSVESKLYYYIHAREGDLHEATHPVVNANANPHTVTITSNNPPIIQHTPPAFAFIGEKININVKIEDESTNLEVKLHYKGVNSTAYETKTMTLLQFSEEGTYFSTIPEQDEEGKVEYYFEVGDGEFNVFAPVNYNDKPYNVQVYTSDVPRIIHTPIKKEYVGNRIHINAEVYDNNGIVTVKLFYRYTSMIEFLPIQMTLREGGDSKRGHYNATLPVQERPNTIYYYIEAWDGFKTGTYPPYNASGSPLKLEIVDIPNLAPEVVGFAPESNIEVNSGDIVTFNVTVIDQDGDELQLLYQWYVDEMPMPGEEFMNFTYYIGKDEVGTHTIKVKITDQNGGETVQSWTMKIGPMEDKGERSSSMFSSNSIYLIIIAIVLGVVLLFIVFRRRRRSAPGGEEEEDEDKGKDKDEDIVVRKPKVKGKDKDKLSGDHKKKRMPPGAGDIKPTELKPSIVQKIPIDKKGGDSTSSRPDKGLKGKHDDHGKKVTRLGFYRKGDMDDSVYDEDDAPVGPAPIPTKHDMKDLFLIHANGNLISHIGTDSRKSNDKDILSGMLTAIQDFIKDGFSDGADSASEEWNLDHMKFGDQNILIERTDYMYIAVVVKGDTGIKIRNEVHDALKTIDLQYSHVLRDWSGSLDNLKGINEILAYKFHILKPESRFDPGTKVGKKQSWGRGKGRKPDKSSKKGRK
ncbi:MAG: hypothetical protein JSV49_08995 [Thermoplasmata archaeon]|nr:MAG: hypothetical protein JSV49_08995 [Thermoplasmata archaeon]